MSKFQNATAEAAYDIMLEGFAEDSIYDGDETLDLVTVEGRHVIIRTDSQGFVWVHDEEQHHSVDHARIERAWDELREAGE